MINSPETVTSTDNLTECMIELAKKEACYFWGDSVLGKLNLKLSEGSIEITSLRILIHGYGKVNCKGKKDEMLQENMTYMKKFSQVVTHPLLITSPEYSFPIDEVLPDQLPTSVYSSKGHIQYQIMCTMEYKTSVGNPSIVKAVRGITVIETLNLNSLPRCYFEQKNEFEQRKFGWFACTGGNIRLSLAIERTAFVCGEAFSVSGKIENKSDHRIEKVSATFQRKIQFGNDVEDDSSTFTYDLQDVQEDLLAMYIEESSVIKIDKKIHIPPVAPSTPTTSVMKGQMDMSTGKFPLRRKSQHKRLSLSSQRSRQSVNSLSTMQRIMLISYRYNIRVKTGGVDVIDIVVPVVIGSVPLADNINSGRYEDPLDQAIYKLSRHDKAVPLLDEMERSLCNKAQLQHVNKYPFFADLPTSSKQSKKLHLIAKNIYTETKVMSTIKDEIAENHKDQQKQ